MMPASGRRSECQTPLRRRPTAAGVRVDRNAENGLILQAECLLCRF